MARQRFLALGRWVPLGLTVLVGLAALRAPGSFGLGVVATLAVAWLLVGLGRLAAGDAPARVFWAGFLLMAGASLAVSFGPWSDARQRRAWPDAATRAGMTRDTQPVTRLLVGLLPVLRPQAEAVITWGGTDGVATTLRIVAPFDGVDGLDPLRDQVGRLAARLPMPVPEAQRARRAADLVMTSLSMADYQAIGHVLAALGLGALAGLGLRLWSVGRAVAGPRGRPTLVNYEGGAG
jgi:hypothetical protein